MKVLITGAHGFLGTYFKHNISLDKIEFFYGTTSTSQGNNDIVFGDLYHDINKVIPHHNFEGLIHFASIIPQNFESADFNLFQKNIEMMNNLYGYAVQNKLKQFIYVSGFGSMSTPELYDVKDYYTLSKITGEHFCAMMRSKSINAASFRVSAPYGEYSRARNVINIFIEKALKNEDIILFGSGSREQNFTYAGDIVNAIALALEDIDVNGVYNIVGKRNISMLALAKLIITLTNSKSPILFNQTPDPQEDYRPSYRYTKAYNDFGYEPLCTLEEGLAKYIEWYKSR